MRAVERLRALDITRFPEPRPVRGFCAAGTVNQGRAPWLTTLLPADLSMKECCAAAQGLRSPYETASVVSPSIQAVVDCVASLGDGLPTKRRHAMKEFKNISKTLERLSKEMRDSLPMPAHIKQVSGERLAAFVARSRPWVGTQLQRLRSRSCVRRSAAGSLRRSRTRPCCAWCATSRPASTGLTWP